MHVKRIYKHIAKLMASWIRVLLLIWQANPRNVILLLLCTLLSGFIPAIQIQLVSLIIQSAADAITNRHAAALVNIAVAFVLLQGGVVLIAALLQTCQQMVQTFLQLQLVNHINVLIMAKAASLDIHYFEDPTFYDMLQRANGESMYRPYQILTLMITLVTQGVTLISVLIVLMTWNWWLGLLLLLAPLPAAWAQIFYGQKGYQIERERSPQRRQHVYLQYLLTNVHAAKEIRLFRLAPYFLGNYRQLCEEFFRVDSRLSKRQALVLIPFVVVTNIVTIGVQVYAVIGTVATGYIGRLAGYLQAIAVVQQTLEAFLRGLSQLYQSNLFISNLFEFLDISPSESQDRKLLFPEKIHIGIEFKNVSFVYPGTDQKVLNNLNLSLRAGECVALVGQNGAGKTTLVKLLTRLYEPTEGEILLEGVPLKEYNREDLRKNISVIFQDFVQYEMKVRENVGFGYIEEIQNDSYIQSATEQTGAATVIRQLPHGYDTMLGRTFEQGHELSIGQWQKIALARTFMRRAPIIILDEPTAAIDAEAEAELFSKLRDNAKGATTLLISHRFSTVRTTDRIIVFNAGQIIEDGNHETLMRLNGTYARLFSIQAAGYNLDNEAQIAQ